MHSDSYFSIGKAHTVCEDYARDGKIPGTGRVFAIVSDGCSSSRDTDFGSRFLTMGAISSLQEWLGVDPEGILAPAIRMAQESQFDLALSVECLDATLLVAHETEDGKAHVLVSGDGVVLARHRDGSIESWEIDMQGAPGYYSYRLNYKRFHEYLIQGYGKRIVTHRIGGVVQGVIESLMAVPTDVSYDPQDLAFTKVFNPEDYDLVMVLTDGVQSFRNTETLEQVPLVEVLPHVADVRNPTGAFLRRAHNWFLTKTCPKLNWQHSDDFGSAAIFMDLPVKTEDLNP